MINELENMNYSDLIYKFIDGDINHLEQTILFKSLSENSDLQQEFQQAVAIQKGFEFDKSILAPSVNLTNKVFAKAGFSSTVSPITKLSFLSSFVKPAIFTILGVILTSTYFIFNNNSVNQSLTITPIPQQQLVMDIPSDNNILTNLNTTKSNKANTIVHKNIAPKNHKFNINTVGIPKSNDEIAINYENNQPDKITPDNYSIEIEDNRFGALIEVRGISGLAYLPVRNILPQENKVANNISLALLKKLDDNQSFGLILGQEALQLYSVKQIDGNFNFELQPNLFWLGGLYRYSGKDLYGPIKPFAEIMLGGTKYGPLGKFTAGLIYNPQDFISMSLGLETTALMYKYLGDYKLTEKFSLIYGLGIHF